MTHYPKTREEYKAAILEQVTRLMGHVLADDPGEHSQAEYIAKQIHYDVRELFNKERWKPTPILDGIRARVPLNERVTLLIHRHDERNGRTFEQGIITAIHSAQSHRDGAAFDFVPRGCRKPRRYYYHANQGSCLKVFRGYVSEEAAATVTPLLEFAPLPFIQYRRAEEDAA
ncbi:hypothetical protein [Deinococcus peraridilitoris]|uniref:Uncharacterized protein n=1 Tax=Deinococcus peraridilitoris (strain DSM 19664 / LMG 22246 / CIP 109416 / KR-200) TaxID=937777 RepID=L0A9G9_DEIPD|nr:hypothetical protein [Deinococcus peraridilitoris]AFZ69777.1 hypothetical protein Deipe_4449 [Deinococcus peraridilitoris DSM 19664]